MVAATAHAFAGDEIAGNLSTTNRFKIACGTVPTRETPRSHSALAVSLEFGAIAPNITRVRRDVAVATTNATDAAPSMPAVAANALATTGWVCIPFTRDTARIITKIHPTAICSPSDT